jgi:hypothetical protein
MALLIVTPTLGGSAHLPATRRSVEELAEKGMAVIHAIVSPVASLDLPEFQSQSGQGRLETRLIEEPSGTRGLYAAINHAVSASASVPWTHLTYINDDDVLGVGFHSVFEKHGNSDAKAFAYGRVSIIDEDGKRVSAIPTEATPKYFEALLAQGISPLNQQGMIIPRELWEKLGGFRAEYRLCADLDFWLRAHRLGWPFRFYPQEVGQFRIRRGQLSGDTTRLAAEIEQVYRTNCPRSISSAEARHAKWRFRLMNAGIYLRRVMGGRVVRGMQMLAGK